VKEVFDCMSSVNTMVTEYSKNKKNIYNTSFQSELFQKRDDERQEKRNTNFGFKHESIFQRLVLKLMERKV
jgi:hypothetical protein